MFNCSSNIALNTGSPTPRMSSSPVLSRPPCGAEHCSKALSFFKDTTTSLQRLLSKNQTKWSIFLLKMVSYISWDWVKPNISFGFFIAAFQRYLERSGGILVRMILVGSAIILRILLFVDLKHMIDNTLIVNESHWCWPNRSNFINRLLTHRKIGSVMWRKFCVFLQKLKT